MKIKLNRILALLLVCVMLLSIVACARDYDTEKPAVEEPVYTVEPPDTEIEPKQPDEDIMSTTRLAHGLREQFADNETVEFQESLWDVPRDQKFYVDLEFDVFCDDFRHMHVADVFGVFADAELTNHIRSNWTVITHERDPSIPEGHSRLQISPMREAPIGRIGGRYFCIYSEEIVYLEHSGEAFIHQDLHYTWGYLSHFYLALLVDPVTAEPLERPTVQIFTLENQLDAPRSEFFITEYGLGAFRWNEVEGADYYVIVRFSSDGIDVTDFLMPIGHTTDTTWIHPDIEYAGMNLLFSPQDGGVGLDFAVIAVNSETHSAIGNVHSAENIASRLIVRVSTAFLDSVRETDGIITGTCEDGIMRATEADAYEDEAGGEGPSAISRLPMQFPLEMIDGSVVHRRIIYDFECCHIITQDVMPGDPDGELVYVLETCFRVEGTTFKFSIWLWDIDLDTYEDELQEFLERMDDAALRGGGSKTIKFTNERPHDEDIPLADDVADEVHTTGDRIFANTALSAFLAYNLMAGNEFIDLSEFPESANFELLVDAFFEAIYQNPLILHVAGAGSIPGTNVLVVEYKESTDTIRQQQDAIRQIVPEIIAEIITDDMTDLEKSIAINQFLVDTTEYDWDALDNAEQNNFQSVDDIFNDSFTAYGILINRVGVCAGYAAAFRLLADEAGLESIVVTGYLEGFLPHAWNRVYIDGQWYTIDVTNNANEFLFNVFMHLPDDVAGSVLVEDGAFIMNDFLGQHRADGSANEYFSITDRFFDRSDISLELANLIQETGSATLRTDFDLDDDTFFEIAVEVMFLLGTTDLYGFHWLGVIYMTDGS